MARAEFRFQTKAEAIAFKQGVEYVNDSALEVYEPVEKNSEWLVEVEDEDEPGD